MSVDNLTEPLPRDHRRLPALGRTPPIPPGSIASWHEVAAAIRIGSYDLLAAGRVLSDALLADRALELADVVTAAADALDEFVAQRWGYRPRLERGPARTCMTIMKGLHNRFGDRAVLLEAEKYHRSIIEQIDQLSAIVGNRLQDELIRQRHTIATVAAALRAMSEHAGGPSAAEC